MTTKEKTLTELVNELGIKLTSKRIDAPEKATEWQQKSNAYRVTLRYQDRSMSFNYYQGTGIKENPNCEGVVACLNSDLNILNSCQDFKCFVDCFGLDIHSQQTYTKLKKQSARYENFIGDSDVLSTLLEIEY